MSGADTLSLFDVPVETQEWALDSPRDTGTVGTTGLIIDQSRIDNSMRTGSKLRSSYDSLRGINRIYKSTIETPPSSSPSVGAVDATEVIEETGWLANALQRLFELRLLENDWSGYGSEKPNELAITAARNVLYVVAEFDLEPRHIDPSVEEGVCISFRKGDRYADIECFNSSEVLAAISDKASSNVWSVAERGLENAVIRIGEFLCGDL